MCGRFTKMYTWRQLHRLYSLSSVPAEETGPHYNVAPMQLEPVVRQEGSDQSAELLRWGLVPPWARDESVGGRIINARSETAAKLSALRAAFMSMYTLQLHGSSSAQASVCTSTALVHRRP